MNTSLDEHIRAMLQLGKKVISSSPILGQEVGTTNVKGDKTIGMDVAVEQAMIDYVKQNDIPAHIFSEEIGFVKYHSDPQYIIAFDPLDGSTNYKIGKNIYPYGFLVAIYYGLSPKLQDVVAAGAIEYSRDLAWIYKDGKTYDIQGNAVILKQDWKITKSTPVYLDLYYKDGYEKYRPLAQQVFMRNMGSTIGNLSYVLSNIATAVGGVCMRPEEIGAIYALVTGAGGVAVNHAGEDIGTQDFSAETTYEILAGCPNVIEFMVNKIQTGEPPHK